MVKNVEALFEAKAYIKGRFLKIKTVLNLNSFSSGYLSFVCSFSA